MTIYSCNHGENTEKVYVSIIRWMYCYQERQGARDELLAEKTHNFVKYFCLELPEKIFRLTMKDTVCAMCVFFFS